MIESWQVAFFGAKLLLTGGTSSDAALAAGKPITTNLLVPPKLGYSVCAL